MKKTLLLVILAICIFPTVIGSQQVEIPRDTMFPKWLSGKLQVQNQYKEGTIAFYKPGISGNLSIPSKGCRITLQPNRGIKIDIPKRQFTYTSAEASTISCKDNILKSTYGIIKYDNAEFDEDPFLWVRQARPQAIIVSSTTSSSASLDLNSVYILITGNRDMPYLLLEMVGSQDDSVLLWIIL